MSIYYLDASALVKRYVNEVGSGWVRALTAEVRARLAEKLSHGKPLSEILLEDREEYA